MTSHRVFVSFARDQETLLGAIFERLEAHNALTVWNYGEEGQEVPIGADLSAYLRERLASSDLFVAIVTKQYFASPFAELEVAEAVKGYGDGRLRIFPLVDAAFKTTGLAWPAGFAGLDHLKYESVDFASMASVDAAIAAICHAIGIDHQPLVKEDPRLPIMGKVFEEVRRLPRGNDRENAVYHRLMRILLKFREAYQANRREEAQRLIELLIQTHRFEDPSGRCLYYPAIIRATLLGSLGRLDECHKVLDEVEAQTPAEEVDGNLHAARGFAFFHANRFAAAAAAYDEAFRRIPADVSNKCNAVVCRLRAGERLPLAETFEAIDESSLAASGTFDDAADRKKIELFKAVACVAAGKTAEARNRFEHLMKEPRPSAELACEYAALLLRAGSRAEAQPVLEAALAQAEEPGGVLHRLAQIIGTSPEPQKGLAIYRRLAAHRPALRRNFFEAMRGAWRARALDDAKRTAADLLDASLLGLPSNAWDFYCSGAACWVLGQHDRAQYDFERSGYRPVEGYQQTLGRDDVAAS